MHSILLSYFVGTIVFSNDVKILSTLFNTSLLAKYNALVIQDMI